MLGFYFHMTNPIEIIKHDHRTVESLFKEYEDLGDEAYETKKEVVGKIIKELKLHTEMEEKLFYPRLKEAFTKEEDKMLAEAYIEHDVAKRLLEKLDVTHAEDENFDATVKVLNENIAHHIKEEEEQLLPTAEKEINPALLNSIGEEMKAFKLESTGEEN
jgi:hemerythrin-like domain-containing protein